jgi:hypothetical protein
MKERRGLSPQMNSGSLGTISFQTGRATGQSDRALDERTQLFRLRQRGNDAIFARIDQRSGQVTQHRDAMLCGPT